MEPQLSELGRIVQAPLDVMAKHQRLSASGKLERNPERFYCPYPNCTRSFAELWRLKVNYCVLQDRPKKRNRPWPKYVHRLSLGRSHDHDRYESRSAAQKRHTPESIDKQQLV